MIELALKEYLDEKFAEVNCKLNKLEQKRQVEHDVVISACKDISFVQDEIREIKLNAVACKENCTQIQQNFQERVTKVMEPKISAIEANQAKKIGKWYMWVISGALIFMMALNGILLSKYFSDSPQQKITQAVKK